MSYATDEYSKYEAASVPGAFCVQGVNKMRQFSYQGGRSYVLLDGLLALFNLLR